MPKTTALLAACVIAAEPFARADLEAVRKVRGAASENVAQWTKLADAGDGDAALAMTFCHLWGYGVAYDPEAARRWAIKASKNGNAHAGMLASTYFLPTNGAEPFRRPFDRPEIVQAYVDFRNRQVKGEALDLRVLEVVRKMAAIHRNPDAVVHQLSTELEGKKSPAERNAFLASIEERARNGDMPALFVTLNADYRTTGRRTAAESRERIVRLRRCLAAGIHDAAWMLTFELEAHPEAALDPDECDRLAASQSFQIFAVQSYVSRRFLTPSGRGDNPRRALAWLKPAAEQDDLWSLRSVARICRDHPELPDAAETAAAYEARAKVVLKILADTGEPGAVQETKLSSR